MRRRCFNAVNGANASWQQFWVILNNAFLVNTFSGDFTLLPLQALSMWLPQNWTQGSLTSQANLVSPSWQTNGGGMLQRMILCSCGALLMSEQLLSIQSQPWLLQNRAINSWICVHFYCGYLKSYVAYSWLCGRVSAAYVLSLELQGQLCGSMRNFACGLCGHCVCL